MGITLIVSASCEEYINLEYVQHFMKFFITLPLKESKKLDAFFQPEC